MTLILGIDVSSFRIDGALLQSDGFSVHHEILGKPKNSLVDRVRNVHHALGQMMPIDNYFNTIVPEWIVIEDAYGMSGRARKALDLTVGALVTSCPAQSGVKLLKASEWRSYLGSKNTKIDGHDHVIGRLANRYPAQVSDAVSMDEHELDALGVALGWEAKLNQGDTDF